MFRLVGGTRFAVIAMWRKCRDGERPALAFGSAVVGSSLMTRPSCGVPAFVCNRDQIGDGFIGRRGAAELPAGGHVMMADISKPRPGVGGPKGPQFAAPDSGGGGVAVITKPTTKQKTKRKEKTEHEPSWRVLLHNDDVHTFDYVTGAIVKVCVSAPFYLIFSLFFYMFSRGYSFVDDDVR